MHWDGKIGPGFFVILALAALQGLTWISDSKAALGTRISVIETQMIWMTAAVLRIDNKVDMLKK